MRDWFEHRFIEKDAEMLQRVKEFSRSISREYLAASTLVDLANELAAVADHKVRASLSEFRQHSNSLPIATCTRSTVIQVNKDGEECS
jgi:hypothetical protein